MYYCYKCKKELDIRGAVGKESRCLSCQSYVHCCFNCKFYRQGMKYKCDEPNADFIGDKQEVNPCDYFVIRDYTSPPIDHDEEVSRIKAKLDALFKK